MNVFLIYFPLAGDLPPPSNLVISEVTPRSFRLRWSPPPESVDRYRVEYYPTSGGSPKQVSIACSSFTMSSVTLDFQHHSNVILNLC